MKLKNFTFEQWRKNHLPTHNDKWYRELYPFGVFKYIDFGNEFINRKQKIELQDNNRYRTTFDLSTLPKSKTQEWKNRKWNTTFQVVYSQDFNFITVFKKKANRFSPIYSIDRDIWVCYSFSEEKAHRLAFYNANQCKNLIVVFCNPTYTRHHRCDYIGTKIISLYELSELVSSAIRKKYENTKESAQRLK